MTTKAQSSAWTRGNLYVSSGNTGSVLRYNGTTGASD